MAENKWYSTRIRIFGKTALREIVWVILGLSGSADPCFLGAERPSAAPENLSR